MLDGGDEWYWIQYWNISTCLYPFEDVDDVPCPFVDLVTKNWWDGNQVCWSQLHLCNVLQCRLTGFANQSLAPYTATRQMRPRRAVFDETRPTTLKCPSQKSLIVLLTLLPFIPVSYVVFFVPFFCVKFFHLKIIWFFKLMTSEMSAPVSEDETV